MAAKSMRLERATEEFLPPAGANELLTAKSAEQRVLWALQGLPGAFALTSSFGAQAAVSLHLLTQINPTLPVIFIDTGYLFAETYAFVEQLTERLSLNLHCYRAARSPAWQEARHGQRWQQGLNALKDYNRENKVEPLARAFSDLNIQTWFAGLRRQQADTREHLPFIRQQAGRYVVHPIADWSNRDVHQYLKKHDLPYHPLWEQGYVSIGDWHSTRALGENMHEQDTRFGGQVRECGLHDLSGGEMI